MKRFHRICLLTLALILALSLFTACAIPTEALKEQATADAGSLMDCVMAGNRTAFLGHFNGIGSNMEREEAWKYFSDAFKDSSTYEVSITGFKQSTQNGTTTAEVDVSITDGADTEMALRLYYDEELHLTGLQYANVTKKTGSGITVTQLILGIVSVLFLAFSIWMLADAIKRPMAKKALWIILILLNVGFTVGSDQFLFNVRPLLFFARYTATESATLLTFGIPLGAIIYFFRRKKLTLLPPPVYPTAPNYYPPYPNYPQAPQQPMTPPVYPQDPPMTPPTPPSDPSSPTPPRDQNGTGEAS